MRLYGPVGSPSVNRRLASYTEVTILHWYQKLSSKVLAISILFFLLLVAGLWMQYASLRDQLTATGKLDAYNLAKSATESIKTLTDEADMIFLDEEGETRNVVDKLVTRLNNSLDGVQIHMVHSKSIDVQYGADKVELSPNPALELSLADGVEREYETEDSFVYVASITAREECVGCHLHPDGSGKLISAGYVLGLAVGAISKDPMNKQLSAASKDQLRLSLVICVLLLTIAAFNMIFIVKPLKRMLATIQTITAGNLSAKINISQNDEIGRLAENVNLMTNQLDTSFNKLQSWNSELEREVKDQTSKITEISDFYQSIIDSTQKIIITTGTNLLIDSVNSEWDSKAFKYGYTNKRHELIGTPVTELLPPSDNAYHEEACLRILQKGEHKSSNLYYEILERNYGDKRFYLGLTISPLTDSFGEINGLVFVITDVTKETEAEHLLRIERNKLNAIMDGMGEPVMIIDQDYTISYMNKAMEAKAGGSIADTKCYKIIAGKEEKCPQCTIDNISGTTVAEIETINGQFYVANHTAIVGVDGKKSIIGVYTDITHRYEIEKGLKLLSITDKLTGLYNKGHFMKTINDEMVRAQRQSQPLVLLFLDIDKFKHYNDTYGHVQGDICLSKLGDLINSNIREHVDTGFRYGGEEFTVLLPGITMSRAFEVAQRISDLFRSTNFAPANNGETGFVTKTLSIGIAQYNNVENPAEFIERSDIEMYEAKRNGGDRIQVVASEMKQTN